MLPLVWFTVSGRESYVCVPVVLETESSLTHTQTDASDHEYLHDITLADAIAFQVELVLAHD